MKKITSILFLFCFLLTTKAQQPTSDRMFWLQQMDKMARPVMQHLAGDSLRIVMPQVTSQNIDNGNIALKYNT